ncbi:uncharacterized protein LOC129287773 [Prosopis cineraria]|uniref:uncharacterized protein LOC129287773 n=1 Tax=Prosopis cineraria TaxID=364024 RepID=UPI002410039A|nr:uncharacterized protein LOC129287773 [Prosopis cineraria]
MQILQWLCKRSQEQERQRTTKTEEFSDQKAGGKHIIQVDHHELSGRTKRNGEKKVGCKNLKIFAFTCRKDIPKTCFYSTLNLMKLASFNRSLNLVYPMKMKRQELSIGIGVPNKKTDSHDHVRNPKANDETKRDKTKPASRMKEIVRWAAASRTEKGGKLFNGRKVAWHSRRGTVKAVDEDDEAISGSTTSLSNIINAQRSLSATTDHVTRRKGNWITSDSEFVVLEL